MSVPVLELRGVSKRFGRTVVADNVRLAIERGEFFTLLGPSGSGKSTILRIVAGLEQPDAGQVLIAGQDVAGVPPWQRRLGMVFQHYALFPHMTVAANVGYGLRAQGVDRDEAARRVQRMLGLVGLDGMHAKNPTLLSGGEQQRVAFARALAAEPSILLLDEPLSALDEKIRREMQMELKHIQKKTTTTFLYVTHDQEEALIMSDRIAVVNEGSCVQCDAPEALYRRPRTRFVAGFFRGCNVLEAELSDGASGVAVSFAGITLGLPAPRSVGRSTGGIAIRAENLHIGPAAAGHEARLDARLEEVVYRGTNTDYRLRLADGQAAVATVTRRQGFESDRPVPVGLDAADVVLLDE